MDIIGSVIREQHVTFAVVQVDGTRVRTKEQAEDTALTCARFFPGMPIVLMAVTHHHAPTYWGRRDLVQFMSQVHPSRVPWKKYKFH